MCCAQVMADVMEKVVVEGYVDKGVSVTEILLNAGQVGPACQFEASHFAS